MEFASESLFGISGHGVRLAVDPRRQRRVAAVGLSRYALGMRTIEGEVVDGRVVVPGERLRDGLVTVIVDDDAGPRLSDDDIAQLRASQAAIRQGEYLTANEVFDHLRRKRA